MQLQSKQKKPISQRFLPYILYIHQSVAITTFSSNAHLITPQKCRNEDQNTSAELHKSQTSTFKSSINRNILQIALLYTAIHTLKTAVALIKINFARLKINFVLLKTAVTRLEIAIAQLNISVALLNINFSQLKIEIAQGKIGIHEFKIAIDVLIVVVFHRNFRRQKNFS